MVIGLSFFLLNKAYEVKIDLLIIKGRASAAKGVHHVIPVVPERLPSSLGFAFVNDLDLDGVTGGLWEYVGQGRCQVGCLVLIEVVDQLFESLVCRCALHGRPIQTNSRLGAVSVGPEGARCIRWGVLADIPLDIGVRLLFLLPSLQTNPQTLERSICAIQGAARLIAGPRQISILVPDGGRR